MTKEEMQTRVNLLKSLMGALELYADPDCEKLRKCFSNARLNFEYIEAAIEEERFQDVLHPVSDMIHKIVLRNIRFILMTNSS